MPEASHIRSLGFTHRQCLHDLKTSPGTSMVVLAIELTRLLDPIGIRVNYVNTPDKDINPDGLVGRFEVIQFKPSERS
jgi:hypothetical protein